ncbi:aspartate/glutamate racemase family protein [Pleomorphomonas carboxyditropha]|uniref:Hydantoin racemase n=1 Tax=Pleomorphomonas carboxyditropha TaxID=2023338 RepID=A0A2G9WZM6_9HYPH|nr:aspartate/glutamate racemase family protein [Pleomorphomonas carboxyditropha]PIP00124.1 hydantoin racemase [Pleomorphomonas carboxyditropha]
MPPVKIMYLNPVADNPEVDRLFADMARAYKLAGTEVHVTALPRADYPFSHIEYRTYEALVTGGIVRAARAAAREGFDAFTIGCFYDTALHDAREISGAMAVTAPCIASCEIAASLANRFAVIVVRSKCNVQMGANIREYGYGDRFSGFYEIGLGVDDLQRDHAETERRLKAAGRRAVDDGAEMIVLGCTMEIGFYKEMEAELGVPVIDSAIASLKRAEYAALLRHQCGWVPSRTGSCEAPTEAEIARFDAFGGSRPVFGSRIVVEAS